MKPKFMGRNILKTEAYGKKTGVYGKKTEVYGKKPRFTGRKLRFTGRKSRFTGRKSRFTGRKPKSTNSGICIMYVHSNQLCMVDCNPKCCNFYIIKIVGISK